MNSETAVEAVQAFNLYWKHIYSCINYLMSYGHNEFPDWEYESDKGLLDALEAVHPFLITVSRPQVFEDPEEHVRITAQNYHEALVLILNPPERWFQKLWILNSKEYLEIIAGAKAEEDEVLLGTQHRKEETGKSDKKRSKKKKRRMHSGGKRLENEFSFQEKILLDTLIRIHENDFESCPCTPHTLNRIAEGIQSNGTPFSQPTVTRYLMVLMERTRQLSTLHGAAKYRQLCENGDIKTVLNELYVKANPSLKSIIGHKLEKQVKNIEGYSNKGYGH